jgi:pimeloyl-ACP methyl ester carboxylesterase
MNDMTKPEALAAPGLERRGVLTGAGLATDLDLWRGYDAAASKLARRFQNLYALKSFDYEQPVALQKGAPQRLRKPYTARVAYADWGPADAPVIICCGGVANTAMRFSFLAAEMCDEYRIICMDWLGRGFSGWLADETEYTQATYTEQLRQLIAHLGSRAVTVLGSSLGGSVAIALAARHPRLVQRLVLNDIGPYIPSARRRRRSETLARFYVFRSPEEMLRRVGAAQKNDGPVSEDIRLFLTYFQTRWSSEDGGRVYRYDPRAMMAYRKDARHSLDQWEDWARVACPVMLLHGMESDALSPRTIARMRRNRGLTLAHIPQTGHTPLLSDRNQTHWIRHWLKGDGAEQQEFSVPYAPLRKVADS